MDELELLKQKWNQPAKKEEFKTFSEADIYAMIKQKSVSTAGLLFLLGSIEILLWMTFDFFYGLDYKWLRIISFILFFGLLCYSFFRIKNTTDAKKLMKQILLVRYVVIVYVIIAFGSMILEILLNYKEMISAFYSGVQEGWRGNERHYKADPKNIPFGIYIGGTVSFIILMWIIYAIYMSVYGNLLQKLKANYSELTNLEESNA